MRVLFDNDTPRGLARALQPQHNVTEARALGWAQLSNGDLLNADGVCDQAERIVSSVFSSLSLLRSLVRAMAMVPELSKQARVDAIASIQHYFRENMQEPVGELAAGLLLNFFVQEIGPVVYNAAISDAQGRLQQRVADLNGELYADEFQYWSKAESKRKNQRS